MPPPREAPQAPVHTSRARDRSNISTEKIPQQFVREPLSSILVLGATGRIGPAVARHVATTAPGVKLRLVVRSPAAVAELQDRFPTSEVVCADYLDRASLHGAVRGMAGIFVVTPTFLDERSAMTNLVDALAAAGSVRHVVRILGDVLNVPLHRVPQVLRDYGGGTAIQHMTAHDVLESSGLPITYLNIAATYMDNLLRMRSMLRAGQWITPIDRLIGYVDPREVGEIAARLLLSPDSRHVGQRYNVDNGYDLMRNSETARMLSEELGRPVELVVSEQRFIEEMGPRLDRQYGREGGGRYMVEYLKFEEANEVVWRRTDFAEAILGRPPLRLRQWIREHRELLAAGSTNPGLGPPHPDHPTV